MEFAVQGLCMDCNLSQYHTPVPLEWYVVYRSMFRSQKVLLIQADNAYMMYSLCSACEEAWWVSQGSSGPTCGVEQTCQCIMDVD